MNIVLAHGVLGFRTMLGVDYFNGVKEHIERKYQAKVLVTQVDPTAGVQKRGAQLRQQILDALALSGKTPTLDPNADTHIIAHSMGGLDSRYVLSQDNAENIASHITSLTTVGTPHRGSPIADILYAWLDGGSPLTLLQWSEQGAQEFLDKLGISVHGLRDLTTAEASAFDQRYRDSEDVNYFWTAGVGRPGLVKTCAMLLPTHAYMKLAKGEENDGAVPLSSARHGQAIGGLWPADHFDEVGHDVNRLPRPDRLHLFE